MMDTRCSRKLRHKSFFLNQDSASACCRAKHESMQGNLNQLLDLWQQEHQDLERGIAIPSCESCWTDERQGKISFRQIVGAVPSGVTKVDIWINNLCNHLCAYCSPKFSSTWQTAIAKHGQFEMVSKSARQNLSLVSPNKYQDVNWSLLVDWITKQAEASLDINLLGGEPLMQKNNLERLFYIGEKAIRKITITSNLCPPSDKFLKKVLASWKGSNKIEFNASIDASPDWNHVPRHGFDSKKFMTNLDLIRSYGVPIKLIHTASALSIWDLESFLDWVINQRLDYRIYNLNNPRALEIQHIPEIYRNQICQALDHPIPEALKWALEQPDCSEILRKEQYHYLRQYWKISGVDPERQSNDLFRQWWQEYVDTYSSL